VKKIIVIKAHPKKDSLCNALIDKYIEGAKKSNNEVKTLTLSDLNLENFVKHTHASPIELPKELSEAQKLIAWSNHIVFSYPIWWGESPAALKIFIDMVFQPGFAFKYHESIGMTPTWDKLLSNKSARILVTMDSPPWYYKYLVGEPTFKMMKNSVLVFCGVKPVKKTYFGSVKYSNKKQRQEWLEKSYRIGLNE
jgi:NAD(P)H dehydrogenase (quinone)